MNMKKLLATILMAITLLSGCVASVDRGVKPYIPSVDLGALNISRHGLHVPNIIYPLEVLGREVPLYLDTGQYTLEEFLCVLDPNC